MRHALGCAIVGTAVMIGACAPNPAFHGDDTESVSESGEGTHTAATEWSTSGPTSTCDGGRVLISAAGELDPGLAFTRESIGSHRDSEGRVVYAQAGTARFDHACDEDGCEPLGLLVEPARQNVVEADMTASPWRPANATSTLVAGAAPDGGAALRIADDATVNEHSVSYDGTAPWSDGEVWTFSAFVKADTLDAVGLVNGASTWTTASFSLVDGAVLQTDSASAFETFVAAGSEPVSAGWWRLWLAYRPGLSETKRPRVSTLQGGALQYAGVGGTVLVWGPQLERGPQPTSVQPAASVPSTRAADLLSLDDATWTEPGVGTVVIEFRRASPFAGTEWVAQWGEAAGASIGLRSAGPATLEVVAGAPDDLQRVLEFPFVPGQPQRIAITYDGDTVVAAVDGRPSVSRAGLELPAGTPTVQLGNALIPSDDGALGGHLAYVAILPCRVADVALPSLATRP